MRLVRPKLCALLVVLMTIPLLAAAQEAAEEGATPARETPMTLTINKVIGLPGEEVNVPVLFARRPGAANVTELRVRLSYPGTVIQFVRTDDAYLSRRVNLQIVGKEESGSGDERSLELTFTLPDPQSKEFPSGQIGSIYFKVAAGVPDQVVHLNPQTWIDGEAIATDNPTVSIEPGEVRVSQTPVFLSCFVFSH